MLRLLLGPSVLDRVVALDMLLAVTEFRGVLAIAIAEISNDDVEVSTAIRVTRRRL